MPSPTHRTICVVLLLVFVLASSEKSGNSCPAACSCDVNLLRCDRRQLTDVPGCDATNQFEYLYLVHNSIRELHSEAFTSYPKTQKIDLSHNYIDKIDIYAFSELRYLEEIRLNDNQLDDIEGVFESIPSLGKLILSKNPLQISSSTVLPDSLTYLDLSRCGMESLPPDLFDGLTQLETLILTHNSFVSLPFGFFENLPKLNRFHLRGNPWRCDGDLEQLMLSKQDVIADYKKIHCVTLDGEQRAWSQGSRKTTERIASTKPWIQVVLETSSSDVVRVETNRPVPNSSKPVPRRPISENNVLDTVQDNIVVEEAETFTTLVTINIILIVCILLVVLGFILHHFGYFRRIQRSSSQQDIERNEAMLTD